LIDARDAPASEPMSSDVLEAAQGPGIPFNPHSRRAHLGQCPGHPRKGAKGIPRILGLALLVSGCVTSTVREPEVAPPSTYEAQAINAHAPDAATLDEWWRLFQDAQLDGLIEEALRYAPDAKSALAVLAQAAAVREGTLNQISIPTGQLQTSGTRTQTNILSSSSGPAGQFGTQPGATENYGANFNVSWELDLFGRRAAAKRGAQADFYNAAFTYEASRTSLIANVASSLFQARGLALQLEDARQTARINRELVDIAQARQEAGLGTSADVDQSLAQAEGSDAQVESYQAQLLAAHRSLLVLLGRGFDKAESLPASATVGRPPTIPVTLPGDLLRRRPDIRAAEWKIVSAAATLRIDDLALLPTINLNPGVSLTKTTGAFGSTSTAWSIGGGITLPILDRPVLMATIHGQRAVAEQNVIAYEKAVQTAYGDVETALVYLASDDRRVRMLTAAEVRARSAYEKSRLGYSRGLNDLTTALQAESTWRNVQSQLSSAQITLLQRSVQAFKALGGGWSPGQPASSTLFSADAQKGVPGTKEVR
jgi:multidrug efflux system outer membrane protein